MHLTRAQLIPSLVSSMIPLTDLEAETYFFKAFKEIFKLCLSESIIAMQPTLPNTHNGANLLSISRRELILGNNENI